jgi:hypothetical protein
LRSTDGEVPRRNAHQNLKLTSICDLRERVSPSTSSRQKYPVGAVYVLMQSYNGPSEPRMPLEAS